jgi:replication factor C large subunit
MLAEKYRPRKLSEYVGQEDAKETFLGWISNWKPGKAMMLHGPPGVGKTSLVEAYAAENKLDLIETNASDFRSAAQLKATLTSSVTQQSLFKRGKIFLIDEADGISGYEDKGGVGEMIDMIKSTAHPIVLVANDPYNQKLRNLRQHCELVQFKKIASWDMQRKLNEIAAKENLKIPKEAIAMIARKSQGDMRSAINDLQTVAGDDKHDYESMQDVGAREREVNIFEALRTIFKTDSVMLSKHSIDNVEKDPDEIFWWVENNIAAEYERPEEIAEAFEKLSAADVFRQRIRSRQNWKLLAYFVDMMTAGVTVSKSAPYRKFTRYQYPANIMILGRSKTQRSAAKDFYSKMSKELHCSTRKIRKDFVPYIRIAAESDKSLVENISSSFKMESSDVESIISF